jgi:hypothetical protein
VTRAAGLTVLISFWVASFAGGAAAQSTMPADFSGLWVGPPAADPSLRTLYGKELPFTPEGRERVRTVDHARDPIAVCLPMGPTRGYSFPFQIVQARDAVVIAFEFQHTYRLIHLDGRQVPADIEDYPEWMGYSSGRWEGDTLVIETIAIDDRTWLDPAVPHSRRLRLTERLRKLDDNRMEWMITVDDPVYFTEPWTVVRPVRRAGVGDRILPYSCNENNKFDPSTIRPASERK